MRKERVYNNCIADIPKHKKKTESDKSKSKAKSKHKHEYIECLFIEKQDDFVRYYVGEYCKICGKIGEFYRPMERTKGGWHLLSNKETFTKYGYLEKVSIDEIEQKFIPLNRT